MGVVGHLRYEWKGARSLPVVDLLRNQIILQQREVLLCCCLFRVDGEEEVEAKPGIS